jgi:DNA ligase (NAD+)
MPEKCPSCGTSVVREGAYLLCPAGLSCQAQLRGRIRHYASRDALDIEHLGQETAGKLVARGLVASLADLYRLEPEDLERLEGFAEKSARQLHAAIRKSCKPRLDSFLYALSIRHIGQRLAQTLAYHFGSLEELMAAGRDELEKISDVGPEIAGSLLRFFEENEEVIKDLEAVGVEVQPVPTDRGKLPLEGKTFVFTGALNHYTRSEAQKAVEKLGARATSSVSGNTDYLVVGDNPGQKLDEAEEQGIAILDEEAFERLLSSGQDREAS